MTRIKEKVNKMSENPSLPAPRRRGGQPGNRNAVTHGFYTRRFKKAELKAIDNAQFKGLDEEIRILRLYIRSAMESSQSDDPQLDVVTLGRLLCLGLSTLNRLIRTQFYIDSQKDELIETFNEAIEDLVDEGFIKTE